MDGRFYLKVYEPLANCRLELTATISLSIGTYEESGPPTEVADMLTNCVPWHLSKIILPRATAAIAELDK